MEDGLTIRAMGAEDRPVWLTMYQHLFPDESEAACLVEIDRILDAAERFAYIAEGPEPLGFAEVSIRPFANGCVSQPVPFLEGIWTDPGARRRGVASALLRHIEETMRARGFTELGSDVLLENPMGQGFHVSSGFSETERVIYMRKPL